MPSHWRPARCISSGQLVPPQAVANLSEGGALEAGWAVWAGVDWTNMGRASGMPLDRPPAMFAFPGQDVHLVWIAHVRLWG